MSIKDNITEIDIRMIKHLIQTTHITDLEIAEQFNVNISEVSEIRTKLNRGAFQ